MRLYLITQSYVSRTGVSSCEEHTKTLGVAIAPDEAMARTAIPPECVLGEHWHASEPVLLDLGHISQDFTRFFRCHH